MQGEGSLAVKLGKVNDALGQLERDPKYPGLNSKKYVGRTCPHGDSLFEAYAENQCPGAYRIFYCYMPKPDQPKAKKKKTGKAEKAKKSAKKKAPVEDMIPAPDPVIYIVDISPHP